MTTYETYDLLPFDDAPVDCEWTPEDAEAAETRMKYAMTYEEIGAELGISPSRVHQICKRALRKLRRTQPGALAQLREAYR